MTTSTDSKCDKERNTMKNTIFKGMATAIVTPMTKDGIDYDALARFI